MKDTNCGTKYELPALLPELPRSLEMGSVLLLTREALYDKQWSNIGDWRITQRRIPAAIQERVADWGGDILTSSGDEYPVPYCLGIIYGADAERYRWFSTYKRANAKGGPMHRSETVERLRWLELVLCLTHPGWLAYREVEKGL